MESGGIVDGYVYAISFIRLNPKSCYAQLGLSIQPVHELDLRERHFNFEMVLTADQAF